MLSGTTSEVEIKPHFEKKGQSKLINTAPSRKELKEIETNKQKE